MYVKSDGWFRDNKKENIIGTSIFRIPDLNLDEYWMNPKWKFEIPIKIKAPQKLKNSKSILIEKQPIPNNELEPIIELWMCNMTMPTSYMAFH